VPFQRLARRCEAVHPSPIGLLIHPTFGLWHAYRGGLMLAQRIELPPLPRLPSPCESCGPKPCLSACPVRAFKPGSFDLAACIAHVSSAAGSECRSGGCLARRACPVGPEFRYVPDQMQFHMRAFLDSMRP
jgi:ferredoxin